MDDRQQDQAAQDGNHGAEQNTEDVALGWEDIHRRVGASTLAQPLPGLSLP